MPSARQAQRGKRQQIVQDHGLPAPGIGAVKDHLQQAEDEARAQTAAQAPAQTVEQDGEHGRGQGAAVGQLVELDEAQHKGQGHQNGAFRQCPDAKMFFVLVFHRDTSVK